MAPAYSPALQSTQALLPVATANVPTAQAVQDPRPVVAAM